MRILSVTSLVLVAAVAVSCRPAPDPLPEAATVTVSAGASPRVNAIISFDPPPEWVGENLGRGNDSSDLQAQDPPLARLTDEEGRNVPMQRDPDGHYWFLIDSLAAEEVRTFRLERTTEADAADDPSDAGTRAGAPLSAGSVDSAGASMGGGTRASIGGGTRASMGGGTRASMGGGTRASIGDGSVLLTVGALEVLTYHFRETPLPREDVDSIYRRGGYIHPVYTPSGVLVTDDYPPNHAHHHGIWAAWTNTRYKGRAPDFWNMADGTGRVEPVGLDTAWSGAVHSGFRARNRYVDLTGEEPETVLLETWETRLYAPRDAPYHIFDVHVTQVTAGDSALHLPEYRYGGVGFRGHRQWDGPDGAVFLTSEGRSRADGHATRARWCHIGGRVDGAWAGIAVLGHPDNFRAPQPMRIHPDEPFFNFAPSQAGAFAIDPGKRYEARYRYVVYDGEPNPALLDRLWNDYAHPPVVTVESGSTPQDG